MKQGLGRWVSLLSFGFLLAALLGHGRQLLRHAPDPQGWLWLLLGVGVSLLSLLASGAHWAVVLRWLGLGIRPQPLLLAYLRSNARKYLPGGIWHLATRLQQLRSGGHGTDAVATPLALVAVLLDPLLAAVTALALVALDGLQGFAAPLSLVSVLPLLLLWPRWLAPLLGWLERRKAALLVNQLPADDQAALLDTPAALPSLPQGYPWPCVLSALGFVLLRFAGFACCVLALDLQAAVGWGSWLAGFALAWTAGLVVPGAPAGLGVFEVVLLLRLGVALPEAPLLALAISYRLVVSAADGLAALTAAADQRQRGLATLRN
jgi:glycosyltransferase 2 family protein